MVFFHLQNQIDFSFKVNHGTNDLFDQIDNAKWY